MWNDSEMQAIGTPPISYLAMEAQAEYRTVGRQSEAHLVYQGGLPIAMGYDADGAISCNKLQQSDVSSTSLAAPDSHYNEKRQQHLTHKAVANY